MINLEKVVSDLDAEDRKMRIVAAEQLGNIQDKNAIIPLIKSLKDIDPDVRLAASDSLFKLGPITVDYLIQALDEDDTNVQLRVIELLGEMEDQRAINPLINFLDEKNNIFIRIATIKSLGRFDNEKVIDSLLFVLTDKSYMVRIVVVEVLGEVGDVRIKELLKESLKDESYMVREAAKESIEKIEYRINNFKEAITILEDDVNIDDEIIDDKLVLSLKTCKKCGESKLIEDFYKNRREVDGLSTYCKDCIKSYSKKSSKKPLKSKLDESKSKPNENPLKLLKELRK